MTAIPISSALVHIEHCTDLVLVVVIFFAWLEQETHPTPLRRMLREQRHRATAPSNITVCASWPQTCITPLIYERVHVLVTWDRTRERLVPTDDPA